MNQTAYVWLCKNCQKQVWHVRSIYNRLGWIVDRATLQVASMAGIGPWRCVDCGQACWWLPYWRTPAAPGLMDPEVWDDAAAERVGNYLRVDRGLVNCHRAADRYSEKYRRAVVERLLEGQTTMSQMCRELNTSEMELQIWIRQEFQHQRDMHQQQLDRILALTGQAPACLEENEQHEVH
jgi:transposase-like protein